MLPTAFAILVSAPAVSASTISIQDASSSRPDYYQLISPVSGPQQTLVILVEFSDVKHTMDKAIIDSLVFDQMAKYYSKVSYGQVQIVGRSVGWFTLPEDMKYYGADINPTGPGSDARDGELIADAILAAQQNVNLKDFSRFMIVHAGAGQEDSVENSTLIWSQTYWSGLSLHANDGAVINAATLVPEMEAEGHSVLGVYAHEYGHLFFLPDLYDSELKPDTPDRFVGRWSLMGTGLWLGDPRGSLPAELEAWSRIKLGWITPDFVDLTPNNVSLRLETLNPLEAAAGVRAIEIPIVGGGDYYLVEFRKKVGFDTDLPDGGILITRIDESQNSGGGIVQVMDANSATTSLNDATYHVGEIFKDPSRHVFVKITSNDVEAYSVLVSNQELSSINITTTKITGAQVVNRTYTEQTTLSATLGDESGNQLTGFPVKLQYYVDGVWHDLGFALTDAQGNADFEARLTMNPGEYPIRFLFTGAKSGEHYFAGSDLVGTLNVEKIPTIIQLQGSNVATAIEPSAVNIKVSDGFGRPVEGLSVLVWMDGQLIRRDKLSNGSLTLPLQFELYQLGAHTLKIEVEGTIFFNGSTESLELQITLPIWFYVLVVAGILLAAASVYLVVGHRRTALGKIPQQV